MSVLRACVFLTLKALGARPSNGEDIAMGLVIASAKAGRPVKTRTALFRLQLATKCDPSLVQTWHLLAQGLVERSRLRKANVVLIEALNATDQRFDDLETMAELFGRCGNRRLKEVCLLGSALQAPHRATAWSLLGESFLEQGLKGRAYRCYLQATSSVDAEADDYRELGRVQILRGKYQEALDALERARKMDKTDLRTLVYLAKCHHDMGNHDVFEQLLQTIRASQESKQGHWDELEEEGFDWEEEIFGREIVQAKRREVFAKLVASLEPTDSSSQQRQ